MKSIYKFFKAPETNRSQVPSYFKLLLNYFSSVGSISLRYALMSSAGL